MANTYSSTSVGVVEAVPEIRSSRCVTITETTWSLNLEVTNYAQLEDMGIGQGVTSPVFRAGGYDWYIVFYPNGYEYEHRFAGNASAYVIYFSKTFDVIAECTVSVQGKEGQPPAVSTYGPRKHVFCPVDCYSSPVLVERSKLRDLSLLDHGCFTIRCLLTLQEESLPLDLPGNLERMLGDTTSADVTFRVGGWEFQAHRSVVAAGSPVFHAQLFGPMKEKDMSRVKVVDVEPTIFEMLLHYIYTDSLPRCEDGGGHNVAVMQHLLVAADRYGMDRLRRICEAVLCEKINMDTILTMFALANQLNCKQLKDKCLEFMASSPQVLGAILETDDGFREYFMAHCRPLPLEWGASTTKGNR